MSTYVDTSLLVKLLIDEPGTATAQQVWTEATATVSVSLIAVEARAALAAAARGGRLLARQHRSAKAVLSDLLDELHVVELSTDLLSAAAELAETQALRGYDAVHLAGALATSDVLASADADLCAAAERCGLLVANPLDGGWA